MAKIDRYNGNVKAFASDATGTERTIFGDTVQSDTLDDNITLDLLRGWGVIGVASNPTKQHFNGLGFTLGQLIAYLHQRGVPEWNTSQEYFDGSVVTTDVGIYRLKTAGVGSADPDTDGGINWERMPTMAEVFSIVYSRINIHEGASDPHAQYTTDAEAQAKVDIHEAAGDPHTQYTTDAESSVIAQAKVTTHEAAADPHTQYTTDAESSVIAQGKVDTHEAAGDPHPEYTTDAVANINISVGTGGDYATINEALFYLSTSRPVYVNSGITATINLLAGFVMSEQVLVRGINLGWITITGVDAETTITHTALITDFTTADYGFPSYPAFGVSKGGTLPRIGQVFRFDVAGVFDNKHGVMAVGAGSSAEILQSCGVNDAGFSGIFADRASTINADEATATGAGYRGIFADNSSTINADNAAATGAGSYGIFANEGSTINAEGADATGAGSSIDIIVAGGSIINAHGADGTLNQPENTLASNGIIFQ